MIGTLLKPYRDTKTIYSDLVDIVKSTQLTNSKTLYRGDCIYPEYLKINGNIKFHNLISSWSSSEETARGFCDPYHAPPWYYDEEFWFNDVEGLEFPFKGRSQDQLQSVIFVLKPSDSEIFGLRVADHLNVEEDKEFVMGDEKEYILGNTEFVITGMKKEDKTYVVYVDVLNDL